MTEVLTVPSTADAYGKFTVQLREQPDDGRVTSRLPHCPGFSITSGEPGPGQFRVDYERGKVQFHHSHAGQAITAEYDGLGQIIGATTLVTAVDSVLPDAITSIDGGTFGG